LYKTIGSLRVVEKAGTGGVRSFFDSEKFKKKLKLEDIKKVLTLKKNTKNHQNFLQMLCLKGMKETNLFLLPLQAKRIHMMCAPFLHPICLMFSPLWVQLLVVPNICSLQKTKLFIPPKS
jgi:hypothetical protein